MTWRRCGGRRGAWAIAMLCSALTQGAALAGPAAEYAGEPHGAVDRLVPPADPVPDAPDLYSSWNAQLHARPEPFHGGLATTEEAATSAPAPAEPSTPPWLFLASGVLLGAFLVWLVMRTRPGGTPAPIAGTPAPGGNRGIELLSSQVLTDLGTVLVVNVYGERLVLGVSATRDYVTLLTKIDGRDPGAGQLDPNVIAEALRRATPPAPWPAPAVPFPAQSPATSTQAQAAAIPMQAPAAQAAPPRPAMPAAAPAPSAARATVPAAVPRTAAPAGPGVPGTPVPGSVPPAVPTPVASRAAASRSAVAPGATPPPAAVPQNLSLPGGELPPDEELEALLDELLGKVRGLKPLPKQADET